MRYAPLLLALALLFFWNLPPASAEKTDTVIEGITFRGDAEKGETIRFKLNAEHIPKIFTIQDANPRLVLDFPDTRCAASVNRAQEVKGKLVKKIRVGIHTDQAPKVRVVVDLAPNGEYQHAHYFETGDKTLVVTVSSTREGAEKGKRDGAAASAKAPEAERHAGKDTKDKEQAPKADDGKQPHAAAVGKAPAEPAPAPAKTAEKKAAEVVSAPVKASGPEMAAETATAPVAAATKEPGAGAPQQDIGGGAEKKETSSSQPAAEAAAGHPAATASQEKKTEAPRTTEAKKPKALKEEKAAAKAEPAEKKSAGKNTEPLLSKVTFENTSSKGEMVIFKLNGFHPPKIFGVEKGEPKVICDFADTQLDEQVGEVIPCNGKYVQSVRISKQTKPKKIRAVLSLVPHRNYDLQQVFFKEGNLFVIIVNAQEGTNGKNTP